MSEKQNQAAAPSEELVVEEIPTECWAAVVKNEGPDFHVEVEKVPVPEIKPDEVLIRLNATGLCMSDVHFMLNDWGIPKMSELGVSCPGHEGSGVIVKIGSALDPTQFRVGQRAGLKPTWDVCHVCEYCRTGREVFCPKNIQCGALVDGSYKQYVVSPGRYTTLIPDGVSDYVAGPLMCAAATALSALKGSGAKVGQWVIFPGGGGGVGIQGVQIARAMGMRAIVVDSGREKRELAMKMGAEEFVDFREEGKDPIGEVVRITGGGAHVVVVTAVQAYPVAHKYLGTRPAGTIVGIGLPPQGQFNLGITPFELVVMGHTIKGSKISPISDIDEVLQFAQRGQLHLEPTVVGLSKFNESVQMLKRGEVAGRIVVDFNKP